MAGLKFLYNYILKDTVKKSGQASGILSIGKDVRKLADKKFQNYVMTAQKQGVDLDKLSEQEIKYMLELNKTKAPKVLSNEDAVAFLNQFLKQNEKGKVIKADFGKPFADEVSSADNAADDILVEQMYRTSGPRDLETDSSFLASFIAEDAGKVLDDLPIEEQTKFIERAKNALRRNVKQYQPRETEIIEGIQTTKGLGDLFPKQLEKTITVESVIADIKKLEPIESMKETNKVLRGDGKYKNLSQADREKIASDESVTDHIFERNIEPDPEDFAGGGIAGMLGEPTYMDDNHRVPYQEGKKVGRPKGQFWTTGKGGGEDVIDPGFDELSADEWLFILKSAMAGDYGPIDYAGGGRAGYKDGKGPKMSRRNFLKIMGGLAALPVVGKFFKLAKPLTKTKALDLTSVPIQNAEGMPSWFKPLVNRVIKEGDDVTKQVAWKERQIVHSAKLGENQGVKVYQDLDNQTISVEYKSADNMGGVDDGIVNLEYRAPQEISLHSPEGSYSKVKHGSKKSVKTKAEFSASEAYPYQDPKDYKSITFEGDNTVKNVDGLYSDTSALKQFGTNKTLSKKELEIAKQKQKRVKEINEDPNELAPLYDPPDYASGGRVPMWMGGGLGVGKGLLREIMRHHAKTGTTGLTGSEMLKLVNPKQFNKMLNNPGGIPTIAKEMIEKQTKEMKVDRIGAVDHSLKIARDIKKAKDKSKEMDRIIEALTKDFVDKGMDRKMVEGLIDMFIRAKYPDYQKIKAIRALPNVTDEAILELENISKNLQTKDRKLNASGGLAHMVGE